MVRNNLMDLNNHLFEQLERLNDESLEGESLEKEIKRAAAVTTVAKTLIESGALAVKAAELKAEWRGRNVQLPLMLEDKKE